MIYPIAVISVAVVIVSFIMIFIIPKFEEIFKSFKLTLPGLTDLAHWTPRDGSSSTGTSSRWCRWASGSS